jgi:hypothetical protein
MWFALPDGNPVRRTASSCTMPPITGFGNDFDLPAQLVIAARVQATEAVKSVLALKKKGRKVSQPSATLVPI